MIAKILFRCQHFVLRKIHIKKYFIEEKIVLIFINQKNNKIDDVCLKINEKCFKFLSTFN